MDVIDRKAVLEALDELDSHQTMSRYQCSKDLANTRLGISMAFDVVEAMPTVDAEPVRHGKWILYPDNQSKVVEADDCSVCGAQWIFGEKYDYCPSCGAKMDGE